MFAFLENPKFRGGIHAQEHKAETHDKPIAMNLPLPKKLVRK